MPNYWYLAPVFSFLIHALLLYDKPREGDNDTQKPQKIPPSPLNGFVRFYIHVHYDIMALTLLFFDPEIMRTVRAVLCAL